MYTKIQTFTRRHAESFPSLRPPMSKVFKTLIRRTIIISPGTSFSMSITFRPPQRVTHHRRLQNCIFSKMISTLRNLFLRGIQRQLCEQYKMSKKMFYVLSPCVCLTTVTSVSMKTASNFKAKMVTSEYPSVPLFHVIPWRCLTPSCCLCVLFRTPHRLLSCSEMSGTNAEKAGVIHDVND